MVSKKKVRSIQAPPTPSASKKTKRATTLPALRAKLFLRSIDLLWIEERPPLHLQRAVGRHLSIEARAMTRVAGGAAQLLNAHEQTVAIAVDANFFHFLHVA